RPCPSPQPPASGRGRIVLRAVEGQACLDSRSEFECSSLFMSLTSVGTSRCDVPAREAAGGIVAPLNAARTAQRAVPTRFRGTMREIIGGNLSPRERAGMRGKWPLVGGSRVRYSPSVPCPKRRMALSQSFFHASGFAGGR